MEFATTIRSEELADPPPLIALGRREHAADFRARPVGIGSFDTERQVGIRSPAKRSCVNGQASNDMKPKLIRPIANELRIPSLYCVSIGLASGSEEVPL